MQVDGFAAGCRTSLLVNNAGGARGGEHGGTTVVNVLKISEGVPVLVASGALPTPTTTSECAQRRG